MPLGNHTSQWFGNIYLDKLDKFVKHELKAKYYIRYVDDFVLFSNSRIELEYWKKQISLFLREKLKLELHPEKSRVIPLSQGIDFLGLKIFYHYSLVRDSNRRNFERKLKELKILYKEGQINREQVIESLEGWLAFAKHANSYKYRRELLRNFNKSFPIKDRSQIIRSKKIKNFFRKFYASKTDFSVQKTLLLVQKEFTVRQIAEARSLKEGTVWNHFANLIEHGQLPVWRIMPKKKIVKIITKTRAPSESLKQIKDKIEDKNISYDEIACVKAHLKMKEKILKDSKEKSINPKTKSKRI